MVPGKNSHKNISHLSYAPLAFELRETKRSVSQFIAEYKYMQ